MNKIITISRMYGSGGNQIGRLLADKLDIPFYDREIIEKAAADTGMAIESFENAGSRASNSFLYSLYISATTPMPTSESSMHIKEYPTESVESLIFAAQSKIIKEFAQEGPCVIVGRCADYVLRDNPNLVSVFIWSDYDYRLNRIKELQELSTEDVHQKIKKIDKQRKNYYNFHTNKEWGLASNYDITVRSDLVGFDKCADIIGTYVENANNLN